jgi:hypothetical protein
MIGYRLHFDEINLKALDLVRRGRDCIRKNRQPEPSGEEGLQDVRIVEALHRSAATRKAVSVAPHVEAKRSSRRQRIVRPGVREPDLVKVESASGD